MKIVALVKYPPIAGGVATRALWLLSGLAERGHQVVVVTDALEVEAEYRSWLSPANASPNLEVVYLSDPDSRLSHIPSSGTTLSRLASVATAQARRIGADVIYANYLEPYGVAAHLAGVWTGTPYVIRHAGSDRERLMGHEDLAFTYREIFVRAALVMTHGESLKSAGVSTGQMFATRRSVIPSGHFNPGGPGLDWQDISDRLLREGANIFGVPAAMDVGVPIVGFFGKAAPNKGHFDLVKALQQVALDGQEFRLAGLSGGPLLPALWEAVVAAGLAERTCILPFVDPRLVPDFIRSCSVLAFLENRFPIQGHVPTPPAEAFACGVPVVLSRELAAKEPEPERLKHGVNCFIVDDPTQTHDLTATLAAALEANLPGIGDQALLQLTRDTDISHWLDDYERAFSIAIARGTGGVGAVDEETASPDAAAEDGATWKEWTSGIAVFDAPPGWKRQHAIPTTGAFRILWSNWAALEEHPEGATISLRRTNLKTQLLEVNRAVLELIGKPGSEVQAQTLSTPARAALKELCALGLVSFASPFTEPHVPV